DSSAGFLFEVPGSNSPLVVQELQIGGTSLLSRCDRFIAYANQRPAVQPRLVCLLSWHDGVERVLAA
ncbi:MAG: hypothetical protein WBF12_19695, partial [Bradyrhizobium sp.]